MKNDYLVVLDENYLGEIDIKDEKFFDKIPIEVIRKLMYEYLEFHLSYVDADYVNIIKDDIKSVITTYVENKKSIDIKYQDCLDNKVEAFELDKGNFIYLAGPFFNFDQRCTICMLEYYLDVLGFKVYSPSRDGAVLDNTNDSLELRKKVFTDNVIGVEKSKLVLALIDDKDPGTYFEVGTKYAFDSQTGLLEDGRANIATYSSHGYGVNLMIINSSKGHYTSLYNLRDRLVHWDEKFTEEELAEYEIY